MKGKALRIVFMGTPDFAVTSLNALVSKGYNVVGVITAPDRPAGRGQQLHETAVKQYAKAKGLTILQPEKLKAPDFIDALKNLKADLQVVVAFRMLPEVVWDMPPYGTFNLHASLLPKYRGAAPLNWAIINGETESGVTTFKLQHEIDTGNIIFQEKTSISSDDNVEVLHDKLMAIGSDLVTKTVDALAEGKVDFISQNDLIAQGSKPTPAPKIFKDDCLINWEHSVEIIRNFVRGLSPYPAAWTKLSPVQEGKATTAKIYKVEVEASDDQEAIGKIISDGKTFLKVKAGNGWVTIKELQMAGKKRMTIEDFLRGFQHIEKFIASR